MSSSNSAHDHHHYQYDYHQYHRRLWQLARTRPVLAVGVTSFTVAGVVETYARVRTFVGTRPPHNRSHNDSSNTPHDDDNKYYTLPRSYDREAIRHYWLCRPLSVLGRVGQIMASLGPVGCQWYLEQQSSSPSLDEQQQQQQRQQYHAIQLRQALTHLGPAWVKGGQQLAIRPDLVPPVVLKELSTLCDAVTPVNDEIAWQLLRDELQIDDLSLVFQNIQLVASASLGQVYQATLVQEPNAPTVAIKVQRPGMREAFSLDLFLLQQWGELMDSLTSIFTHQQPYHRAFLDAYSKGSYSELDYENEARNQRLFQRELRQRNCPVKVPDVYSEYTTERVLTTEWIHGVKLADSPPETIHRLIPVGVELFLTQLLDIGRFHADPHSGNLLVTEDGLLCLLDFGLTATVDPQARDAMTNAIVNLLYRDFDTLISEDAKALGFLPQDFDTTELTPLLTKVLTGGVLESSSNLRHRKRKLQEISNELNEIFFRYPFQVPPFFALVTRGLGLLEGIALTGDPDFDIFRASAPYATRRAMGILGRSSLSRRRKRQTTTTTTSSLADL